MKKNIFFIFFSCLIINSSCKKSSSSASNPFLQQYFESNILNSNWTVTLAKDSTSDITADYSNYVFVLTEDDALHGPLKATKNGTTYSGTWVSNDDYSKLTITLPSTPSEFVFLTRSWRFTSKNIPTLELAPWGSTAPIVLHMHRQ